ncbi:hypothetical protein [Parasediminibacterium sp. JCM 36343]|uniref:hypothetical protein n=1 Tax=Parasediminibacterium sp. JCM 36343 TaxID=3374279 RepID=UPI003977F001
MKKLFAILSLAVVFAACGSGENKAAAVDSTKIADSIKMAAAADSAAKAAADTTKKAVDSTKKAVTDSAKKM